MAYLQFGDGAPLRLLAGRFSGVAQLSRRGPVAVALAEDADEERLDAVDPLPVVFPGVGGLPVGVLVGHAPASKQVARTCGPRSAAFRL